HDLIAAGHPRLKFEYAAFYANYPRHWDWREKEQRKEDPAREARNWLVGQAVSAEAALRLTAARAERGGDFAEYDCMACHHGLRELKKRAELFRKRNAARKESGLAELAVGRLPWATWYHAQLPLLKERGPGLKLARLDVEMSKKSPDADAVKKEALAAAKALRGWAGAEADLRKKMSADDVRVLARKLREGEAVARLGWDGGTQLYLGLAAMNYALAESKAAGRMELDAMREVLQKSFPEAGKGEKRRPLYDSPRDYDAEKLLDALRSATKRP
ncbi:MAG: hypothetical protein K2W96_21645, partial [Gemmataceae bacterium]|nr:hypothetical protein [Gemmataceae bacterium]